MAADLFTTYVVMLLGSLLIRMGQRDTMERREEVVNFFADRAAK